jgi:WD repeat-containing protein 19
VSLDYAIQLEMNGLSGEAHQMYEQALKSSVAYVGISQDEHDEHILQCESGYIRTTLKLGNIAQGMKLLAANTDKKLLLECSTILQELKQNTECAQLLERAEAWEEAAHVYIKLKNWSKLGKIMDSISSPALFSQLAKAHESEGRYSDAANAYERAGDWESLVRILVDHLRDIEAASTLVKRNKSAESAKKLAKIHVASRSFFQAIEFHLIAGMQTEAFQLAKSQNMVVEFGELVKDNASVTLLGEIAAYFEGKEEYLNAAKYYFQAMNFTKALKAALDAPVDDNAINLAITIIGEAKNDSLTHTLIDFLMGERDGHPKDAKYIFTLYMSLKQYKEAARTAIIIAREEQTLGNYRGAHDLILESTLQLKRTNAAVPAELESMLLLLHSYILVKTLVRLDQHSSAARMLIRVAKNISKFPGHTVAILTSTVIECYRSGLKNSAFNFAALLMRPEHRNQVDPKFKRKIETIVR